LHSHSSHILIPFTCVQTDPQAAQDGQDIQEYTPEQEDNPTMSAVCRARDGLTAQIAECHSIQAVLNELWEQVEQMKDQLHDLLADLP
jgi:hypothetical protein